MVIHRSLSVAVTSPSGVLWTPKSAKQTTERKPSTKVDRVRKRRTEKKNQIADIPGVNMTTLMQAAVQPRTLETYRRHWIDFNTWCRDRRLGISSPAEIDLSLSLYMEEMYLDGYDLSFGRYALAAMTFFRPELKSPKMQALPRCKQSMQGWRNLMPPQARLPIPWEVTCLIAAWALKRGMVQMAVGLLLAFAMYLRPSELCRIHVKDVVIPDKSLRRRHKHLVVTLHPFEGGIPSKTHEFDETIILDLPHHKFLEQAIRDMIQQMQLTPNQLLFGLDTSQLRDFMNEAQTTLQLQKLGTMHPYRLRHGGASCDLWEHHRNLAEIMKRGRWRAMQSVRRYEKGGRLAQLMSALPKDVQQLAQWAAENIEDLFSNRRLLRRLP